MARPTTGFAELHVHIEGTLEPELVRIAARRNGIDLPEGHPGLVRPAAGYPDLQGFLDAYYESAAVLLTERDFFDLGVAYLRRAAIAGVTHAEMFVDPQSHLERHVPLEAVFGGLAAAQTEAAGFGVTSALIPCFLRHLGPDAALDTYDRLQPFRDRFVGVGLDSTELGFPPALFEAVFGRARADGLHVVAHAGEEGGPEFVREALDVLGAERIDHGIRALEDAELVARLVDEQVPLTVCPLSNVRLRAVPSMAAHPLGRMLDAGLNVTVNSDDPAYFGGYLDDNVAAVRAALGLTDAQVDTLAANSRAASFA